MDQDVTVDVVTEAGSTDKQTIEIPQAFDTVTGVQQFNTLSGTFDDIQFSSFTLDSTITRTIEGVSGIQYNRYSYNGTTPIGARKLKFLV